MEWHCSIEAKIPMGSKRLIHILTKILINFHWGGTGNIFFWKWKAKFQSDWTDCSKRITSPWGGGGGVGALFPENYHPDRSVSFIFRIKFWHNGRHPPNVSQDLTLLAHSAESIPKGAKAFKLLGLDLHVKGVKMLPNVITSRFVKISLRFVEIDNTFQRV